MQKHKQTIIFKNGNEFNFFNSFLKERDIIADTAKAVLFQVEYKDKEIGDMVVKFWLPTWMFANIKNGKKFIFKWYEKLQVTLFNEELDFKKVINFEEFVDLFNDDWH